MKIKLSNRFLKSINNQDLNLIQKKLELFVEQLSIESNNFTSLPKGFYVRRFHSNPNRFKFRVSNKDRIIYELSEDKRVIYFLAYCHHDEQVRTAKRISIDFSDLEIDKSEYKESIEERKYDETLLREAYDLLDKDELFLAKEKFKESGDFKTSKIINKLIDLNKSKADFLDENNRIQILFYSKGKIWARDILKILNRLYSEYRIIPGNYIKITTGDSFNSELWLSNSDISTKKFNDYIKDLVNNIMKQTNGTYFYYRFGLICCFYSTKDKALYNNYKTFETNIDENTLIPSKIPKTYLSSSVHKYKNLKELDYHNKDKLADDILDFIFKN